MAETFTNATQVLIPFKGGSGTRRGADRASELRGPRSPASGKIPRIPHALEVLLQGRGGTEALIQRGERLSAAAAAMLAVVVLLGSQVANVWGFRSQARGHFPSLVFTGPLPLYLDDAAADWAFMRQAKEGAFLFSNPYSVDDHPRNYFNVLLSALGSAARLLDADVVAVYFAAKLLFGAILLAVLYGLARRMFDRPGYL